MAHPRRIRTSARTKFIFCILVVTIGQGVHATNPYDEIDRIMDRAGYTVEERSTIRDVIEDADDANIPLDLLIPRLQEGVAKRVHPRRISQAIRSDIQHLLRARDISRRIPGGSALIEDSARWGRALTVLQAGHNAAELEALFQVTTNHPDRFRPATALYLSLREWGLDSSNAINTVEAAVSSALPPADYPGIAEIMAAGRRERIRPNDMVDRVVSALQNAESLTTLRRRVLR